MIALDSDFMLGANEVMSPLLECSDDGHEFFVVDNLVDFDGCKLPRIDGYGVKLVVDAIIG